MEYSLKHPIQNHFTSSSAEIVTDILISYPVFYQNTGGESYLDDQTGDRIQKMDGLQLTTATSNQMANALGNFTRRSPLCGFVALINGVVACFIFNM